MSALGADRNRVRWSAKLLMAIRGFGMLKVASWLNAKSLFSVFGFISILGIIGFLIGDDDGGTTLKGWMEGPVTMVMIPLLCLSLAGGIVRSEIRDGTIEYLWTRLVTKAQLILGGYVCSVLGVFAIVALLDLLLSVVLYSKGGRFISGELLNLLIAQALGVFTFCSLSLALGSFFRKYMIIGVVYGLLVEVGISSLPSNIALISVSRHLRRVVSGGEVLGPMGGCFAITCLALVFSVLVFRSKSYGMSKKSD